MLFCCNASFPKIQLSLYLSASCCVTVHKYQMFGALLNLHSCPLMWVFVFLYIFFTFLFNLLFYLLILLLLVTPFSWSQCGCILFIWKLLSPVCRSAVSCVPTYLLCYYSRGVFRRHSTNSNSILLWNLSNPSCRSVGDISPFLFWYDFRCLIG